MADEQDNGDNVRSLPPRNQQEREQSADFDPAAAQGDAEQASEPGDAEQSIEDIENGAGQEEEEDGQFAFEVPHAGRKVSLGTLIPRGIPVKYRYKMSGKSIPNVEGGLIDPADTTGLLLVSYVLGDVDVKFTRDDNRQITEATVYLLLEPRDIVNARTEVGAQLLGRAAAA